MVAEHIVIEWLMRRRGRLVPRLNIVLPKQKHVALLKLEKHTTLNLTNHDLRTLAPQLVVLARLASWNCGPDSAHCTIFGYAVNIITFLKCVRMWSLIKCVARVCLLCS